ncbi:hypothetical protein [Streptosporangium roseum]|uniref:hypothetical protein n=1 Tax=Streptosporangium roseum TaxID=2001 RepID=UPI00332465FE
MTEDDEAVFDEFLAARSTALLRTAGAREVVVPVLIGENIRPAYRKPKEAGLRPVTNGPESGPGWMVDGMVTEQSPATARGPLWPAARYGSRDLVRAVPACRPWGQ